MDGKVDYITFITEDNRHRIWIGTFEGGINVYDPTTQKVTSYGSNVNSDQRLVVASYKTRDNIIWISTWDNLYKVNLSTASAPYPHW
jgi:ligand-binding sensor domain-containing protein